MHQVLQVSAFSSGDAFHVSRELPVKISVLGQVLKERQPVIKGRVIGRLCLVLTAGPSPCCLHGAGRGRDGGPEHETSPAKHFRVPQEHGRGSAVAELTSLGLAKYVAGHGHASNADQLGLGDLGSFGYLCVAGRAFQRDVGEDVELH